MRCTHCANDNPPGANYCCACGEGLGGAPKAPTRRPKASDAVRSVDRLPPTPIPDAFRRLMPDQFLQKMVASEGRVQAEKRVITILFSDVKGSTALAESRDPEEVMEIMNGAFEEMIAPVVRYGGTLARLMGDGILAFFGAPVAHDDDPARACRAGLDILEGIGAYARRLEKERRIRGFNVRVGINTGLVVVGEVGNDLRVEYTAMGDAVNVAARMETTAEPGTIRVTEATWRLVERTFEAEPLGGVEVKGKSRPVRTFRVTGVRPPSARDRGSGGVRSPFVGRRAELRGIARAAAALAKGVPSVVALSGEAGVGKSRILEEAEAAFPDIGWAHSRAVPDGVLTGDSMARQLLRELCGAGREMPAAALGEALRHTLASALPHASPDTFAYLARLLNVPAGAAGEALLGAVDAETFRGQTAEAFRTLVVGIAANRPLVLLWDDLHWIDPTSAGILSNLLGSPPGAPVLQVLVARPGEHRSKELLELAAGRYGDRCHTIVLRPLPKTESSRLLSNLAGRRVLSPAARREILEKTGGNAFFIEEVLRSMIDAAPARRGRNRPEAARTAQPLVPETVAAVITARMDRLDPWHREVLQASAVIGRTFGARILALTLGADERALSGALDELSRRDFIAGTEGGGGDGSVVRPSRGQAREFTFRHGITRDVVYEGLLQSRLRELHRRVGESMETLHGAQDTALAATLALHFDKAGVAGKAYAYTLEAAANAKRAHAGQEAVMHYTRALALAADAEAEGPNLGGIHESLGEVFTFLARYSDAVANFDAALSAASAAGRRAVILRKRGRVYEQWGRYPEADADLQGALAELAGNPDRAEEARIRTGLARVHFRRGELDEAASLGEAALAVMDLSRDPVGTAEACNVLGNIHAGRGDLAKAIALYDRSRLLWEEIGHQGGLAVAYNNLGQVYHRLSRWDEAVNHYLRSLALSERIGDRYGTARTCDNLSQAYAELGNEVESIKCLKRAVDIFLDIGKEGSTVIPEMWMQSGTL